MAKKNKTNSIAITGSSSLVGEQLLQAILKDDPHAKIIAVDIKKPQKRHAKIIYIQCDLTDPESVFILGDKLKKSKCKTIIHCALPGGAAPNSDQIHELMVTGTMHTLLAAEAADVKKIILNSTTEVYGALPTNPAFLTEEHRTMGGRHSGYLKDRIDIENQFKKFQERFPEKTVTILRNCTILGAKIDKTEARFLSGPSVPTVLGFDPLVQFVHINDVIQAFLLAIKKNYSGVFNIVGDGVLPISRALKISGRMNLPLPSILLEGLTALLWNINLAPAPSGHINFLKYQFIANGEKAKKIMKFQPVFSSKEALLTLRSLEKIKKI